MTRHLTWAPIARTFHRAAAPLAWYYVVTLALPLAHGAASAGTTFAEHALVVLVLPPLLLVLASIVGAMTRALLRSGSGYPCPRGASHRRHSTCAGSGDGSARFERGRHLCAGYPVIVRSDGRSTDAMLLKADDSHPITRLLEASR